jgi:hypothetical protein
VSKVKIAIVYNITCIGKRSGSVTRKYVNEKAKDIITIGRLFDFSKYFRQKMVVVTQITAF